MGVPMSSLAGRIRSIVIAVLAAGALTGCLTGYTVMRPPPITSCEDFQTRRASDVRRQLKRAENLDALNRVSSQRYDRVATGPEQLIAPIVVRYSEAGNLVSRCDYSRVLHAIGGLKKEKIVLVFVHGWRNDSGPRDGIVYNYGEAPLPPQVMGRDLATFAALATRVSQESGKPVVPVFVSWKGGPGLGPIDVISFWNRRNAADRIARTGELNRLFGAIENISDEHEKAGLDTQTVFIGHSFGSRILLHSLVADMITRTQLAYPPECVPGVPCTHELIKSPADLVLLFNPALEAASYRAIDEFRYSPAQFDARQEPLLLTFQSESDKAVRLYFPISQFLGGGYLNQSRTTGIGFIDEFRTHRMCIKDQSGECAGQSGEADPGFPGGRYFIGKLPPPRQIDGARIAHDSPFKVVFVAEQILDGHTWFNEGGFLAPLRNDQPGAEERDFNDWLARYIAKTNKRRSSENQPDAIAK
jgi:hypothetical protein